MSRPLLPIVIALLMAPSVSAAQAPDSLVKGERIRVVSRCSVAPDLAPDCGEGDQQWTYTGQLESLDPGSLHLRAQAKSGELVIPTSSIAGLYVSDGTKGHFWAGAGIGLVGGALLGAAIGSTTEFCIDSCTEEQAKAGAIAVGAVLGAPVGFLLGGVIGSQIRSDQWRLIPIADQRIGVGPRLGTLGVRVEVRF